MPSFRRSKFVCDRGYRLGLPEWLTQEIDSGQHKGVKWLDKDQRIFQVPWKHASRNGWVDQDVSLFKSWALYTNRYREGIDTPRPSLWKTNFRCAINSHNSIVFLPGYGQKTGDKAHRVIKIVKTPKNKQQKRAINLQPPASTDILSAPLLPLTTGFGSIKFSGLNTSSDDKPSSPCETSGLYQIDEGQDRYELCVSCRKIREDYRVATENTLILSKANSTYHDYHITIRNRYLQILATCSHLCKEDDKIEPVMRQFIGVKCEPEDLEDDLVPETERPNISDLYNVGKALQSADFLGASVGNAQKLDYSNETTDVQVKKETFSDTEIDENGNYKGSYEDSDDDDEIIVPRY